MDFREDRAEVAELAQLISISPLGRGSGRGAVVQVRSFASLQHCYSPGLSPEGRGARR